LIGEVDSEPWNNLVIATEPKAGEAIREGPIETFQIPTDDEEEENQSEEEGDVNGT
jgi:hypothetical protein